MCVYPYACLYRCSFARAHVGIGIANTGSPVRVCLD